MQAFRCFFFSCVSCCLSARYLYVHELYHIGWQISCRTRRKGVSGRFRRSGDLFIFLFRSIILRSTKYHLLVRSTSKYHISFHCCFILISFFITLLVYFSLAFHESGSYFEGRSGRPRVSTQRRVRPCGGGCVAVSGEGLGQAPQVSLRHRERLLAAGVWRPARGGGETPSGHVP